MVSKGTSLSIKEGGEDVSIKKTLGLDFSASRRPWLPL